MEQQSQQGKFQPTITQASTPFVFPKSINASDAQQALANTVELRKPIPLHLAVQKQLEDLKLKNTSGTEAASAAAGSSVDSPLPQGAIISAKVTQEKTITLSQSGVDSATVPSGLETFNQAAQELSEKRYVDGAEIAAMASNSIQINQNALLGPNANTHGDIPVVLQPTTAGDLVSVSQMVSRASSEEVDLSNVIPREKLQPPPPPPPTLIPSPSQQAQVAARKKIKRKHYINNSYINNFN